MNYFFKPSQFLGLFDVFARAIDLTASKFRFWVWESKRSLKILGLVMTCVVLETAQKQWMFLVSAETRAARRHSQEN